jgi:hypothetical protein
MNNFDAAVVTNAGAALLARQQVGGCVLEFTKISVGSGEYTAQEKTNTALQARTALKNQKYSYNINSKTLESSKVVKLSAILANRDPQSGEALFEEGFNINEMGVFCREQGHPETEILYSVAVAASFPGEYMPAYTGVNPAEILQDYFVSVANSANVTVQFTQATYALAEDVDEQAQRMAAFEAVYEQTIKQVISSLNKMYLPGRDLTVVFADEISNHSDEWAWIQARLDHHDLSGLMVGDYIPIVVAAGGDAPVQVHKAEIAGINTYRRTGDGVNEVGYHIDWITRDCYSVPVKWNAENNNNGNSSNAQPFLASNLKNWLDTVVYPRLETKLKNVIKPKRVLAPTRYQSGTTLTDDNSWAWSSFDKLWVPFESEVFDTPAWSTKGFGYGQAVQYPIFANSYEHRMKGAGPDGGRTSWWLASALSGKATAAVRVDSRGYSDNSYTSTELFAPLCFRTMEDAS